MSEPTTDPTGQVAIFNIWFNKDGYNHVYLRCEAIASLAFVESFGDLLDSFNAEGAERLPVALDRDHNIIGTHFNTEVARIYDHPKTFTQRFNAALQEVIKAFDNGFVDVVIEVRPQGEMEIFHHGN